MLEILHSSTNIGSPEIKDKYIAELVKAMQTGYGIAPEQMTGIGPLRKQSLDEAIRTLPPTWKDYAATYNAIPKGVARSTVEEYTRISAFGSQHKFSGFIPEGERGPDEAGTYERRFAKLKYLSTTRSVSRVATMVASIDDAYRRENENAVNFLFNTANRAMLFGKSELGVGGTEWLEFDGFDTVIPDTVDGTTLNEDRVIDALDSEMTYDLFESAAYKVAQYHIPAIPNAFIHSFATAGQLSRYSYDRLRYFYPVAGPSTPEGAFSVGVGSKVDYLLTAWGSVRLVRDYFIADWLGSVPPASATSVQAPTAPASITFTVLNDGLGRWGKYYSLSGHTLSVKYAVCAVNAYGSSAPVSSSAIVFDGTSPDLSDTIRITITNASPLQTPPVYFNIYRQDTYDGVSTGFHPIARIPASSASAGGQTIFKDHCFRLPGRHVAFVGQMDNQTVEWRTLSDLIVLELPAMGLYRWWSLFLLGTLVWGAPERWVKIINLSNAG